MKNLKVCKTCKHEIAKSAKACPNCGEKQKMGLMKKVFLGIGGFFLLLIVISVFSSDDFKEGSDMAKKAQTENSSTSSTTTSKPKEKNYSWNVKEKDAFQNGNPAIAVNLINDRGIDKEKATAFKTEDVAKRPWEYYGKLAKFNGEIGVIEEFPPGSDISKMLGSKGVSSEIVIETQEGVIIDFILQGGTGNLTNGNNFTGYGYVVGSVEVPNKLGGTFTHIVVIGKL